MYTFHRLPSEIFYEIALHLPLTKDVLAFALANSHIHRTLSTPGLFKARLALQGWDITAWKDEDDAAQSAGDLKRWMCIDYIYCRTIQLFDEAAVDHGHFLIPMDTPTDELVLWGSDRSTSAPRKDSRITSNSCQVFDGDKTVNWLEELSKVLPLFVTHHRGGNISRITNAKYHDSLRAYARVVDDIYAVGDEIDSVTIVLDYSRSDYGWFERICFSLTALLIQCDVTTAISIFTDIDTRLSPTAIFSNTPLALWTLEERYFSAFLIQAVLCITLHLNAEHPDVPESVRPQLLAPNLPHFEPHTTPSYSYYSYFGDGAPVELDNPTIMTMVRITSPSTLPSSDLPYMRPWLRDGLASMPLAGLLSTIGCVWAGYYTYSGRGHLEPPMYLELRTSPPPPDSNSDSDSDSDSEFNSDPESEVVPDLEEDSDPDPGPDRMSYFSGEGHDSVGRFTISGRCNTCTGVVRIIRTYEGQQWKWCGMLTPFGMVGTWSPDWDSGWWWIWPREWSPTTT